LSETAFRGSGVPWAVPIASGTSLGGKPAVALTIIRLYRVPRGRAVRRGSASSASCCIGAKELGRGGQPELDA